MISSPMDVDETAQSSLATDVAMGEQSSLQDDVDMRSASSKSSRDEGFEHPRSSNAMEPSGTADSETSDMPASTDLADHIPGMYRILDLVSEQGSGGLGEFEWSGVLYISAELTDLRIVDKIIIAQESFGRFMNDLCPGAYQSLTHVNFNALDQFNVKPFGIYGSKSEIVRYLQDLELIDGNMYVILLSSMNSSFTPG